MERNFIYYGRPEDQPEPIPLRAGPFELVYQAGDLRYIRLGAHEVVRRIYLAARDGSWGTAPNVIERHSVEMGSRGFVIRHIASSRLGDVALAWQAEITGAPDGAITYRIKGAPSAPLRATAWACACCTPPPSPASVAASPTATARWRKAAFPNASRRTNRSPISPPLHTRWPRAFGPR